MADLPPIYTNALVHAHTLPLYTEVPAATERVLVHSTPSSPTATSPTHIRRFLFTTDHLEIDLGEFPCALMHPAYGLKGVVEGTVNFRGKCTHVSGITVKLEGIIKTAVSEHALRAPIAGLHIFTLFSKTTPLVPQCSLDAGQTINAGSRYPFTIMFPTRADGQNVRLPPSYSAIHSGVSSEISYYVQVDVSRKGRFRRNEVRKIPVLFLPKTRPAIPTLVNFPRAHISNLPECVEATALAPTWPCEAQSISGSANLPTVHLFFPIPTQYASGDFIPLAVNIFCPLSPALTMLYASNVEVQLVKKRRIWLDSQGRLFSAREFIISSAKPSVSLESTTGTAYLSLQLGAGMPGREVNFNIAGALDIHYFIRVTVRPPQDVKHLPTFRVDEPIQLTTDSYEDPETVLLTDEHASPALGLTTLRPRFTSFS
ncbi:hypothetical protein BC835DRAFT_1262709 [Cytidiella melzeri]|nr:hypothetical protein BC835DRAFT_1262709 [Cytidiella melzeri]